MKICKLCGVEKPHEYFDGNGRAKDGKSSKCKNCTSFGRLVNCDGCAFLSECKHNIWKRTFTPYCWTTAKYHGLYQAEYQEVTA